MAGQKTQCIQVEATLIMCRGTHDSPARVVQLWHDSAHSRVTPPKSAAIPRNSASTSLVVTVLDDNLFDDRKPTYVALRLFVAYRIAVDRTCAPHCAGAPQVKFAAVQHTRSTYQRAEDTRIDAVITACRDRRHVTVCCQCNRVTQAI